MSVYIYGRNPVKAALLSGKRPVYKLLMQKGIQGAVVEEIREMASRIQLPVEVMEKRFLQKITGDRAKHQGVVLFCEPYQPVDWKTIRNRVLEKKNGIVVFIDSVEDPRNLGAIIRTASVLGVDGVILSKAHSAPLDSEVMKTAAGEMEKLDIAQVNNFSEVLNDFSENGFWLVALEANGDKDLWDLDMIRIPIGIVVGGESRGIRPLVSSRCDFHARIPMVGTANSLNVSVAFGIALYEVIRQKGGSRCDPEK